MSSHIDQVKQFTEQSKGMVCPGKPVAMDHNAVKFIVRMVLSELAELYQTIVPHASKLEASTYVQQWATYELLSSDELLVNKQIDAFKKIFAVLENAAGNNNMPFNAVFDAVHAANMNKKWADGTFHRRLEDGKVIKPDNWQEADLGAVLAPYWGENKPSHEQPRPFNKEMVNDIVMNIVSNLACLINVTSNSAISNESILAICAETIDYTYRPSAVPLNHKDMVEAQIDALIDVYYYILDTMAKHGMHV
jgi:predicted HAD superfamily Cof-like phosphohydrolase